MRQFIFQTVMDITCPSFSEADSDYGSRDTSQEDKIGGLCHLMFRKGIKGIKFVEVAFIFDNQILVCRSFSHLFDFLQFVGEACQ